MSQVLAKRCRLLLTRLCVSLLLLSLLLSQAAPRVSIAQAAPLPSPNTDKNNGATYVVRPGDTLPQIARKLYGSAERWPALYAANTEIIGPNPWHLRPGQVLNTPDLHAPTQVACAGEIMDIPALAAYRGISVEQLREIQSARSLTLTDICLMTEAKLQRAIFRTATPKPDHPGEAVAFRRLQLQDENGVIPIDGYARAAQQIRTMQANPPPAAGINRAAWTWLGPGNIGGRIRSLLIHPTNTNTMWAGSVAGGLWKTTNGGASWTIVDDFLGQMAIGSMAMDPTNANVMYIGTGEGFYNGDGLQGEGVFKSTDGGATWNQLNATANGNWYYVNRLAVHPTNGQIVLAATGSGIWRSSDGGATWSQVNTSEALDLNFDPSNGNKAVASGRGGRAWYSTNTGQSWSAAGGLPSITNPWYGGRVEIAYAPNNPSIVYASVDSAGGKIYKSTNGGSSFTGPVNGSENYLGGQGWYDNIIWVDPTNANTLIVGGIDLWRSTDGGATLTKISQWWSAPDSAHADHHYILEHPNFNGSTNRTVFFANDGGVYKTSNVYTLASLSGWQELNNNLGVTQFYGAGVHPGSGKVVGGTQDNGTLVYTDDTEGWTTMFGGDGGWSAADPTDANYLYGEYVFLQLHRSTNGGAWADYIYSGIGDAGGNANFIAPFVLDPNNANTLLAGGADLWRSTNIKAGSPDWDSIKSSIGDNISAIAVAPGNSNIIWVGHNGSQVYKTTNGTASSPTWTRMDNNSPALPSRYVTRITIDPNNANTVYVTFGGFSADNIWRTTDGGQTWNDATGSGVTGLPNAPVRSLVVHPTNSNWIYAGTEVGVFASEDQGNSWYLPHDGPTNTSVDELFWGGDALYAATHGRGIFKATPGADENFSVEIGPTSQTVCAPTTASFDVTVASSGGFSGNVNLSAGTNPTGLTTNLSPSTVQGSGESQLTVGVPNGTVGNYVITVTGVGTPGSRNANAQLTVYAGAPSAPTLTSPANGATGLSVQPTVSWQAVANADDYTVEVATTANFANGTVVFTQDTSATNLQVASGLLFNHTYYWRVTANNFCGAGAASQVRSFSTGAGQSTLYLSSSTGGKVGGISFADEDVLVYNPNTATWAMYVDGSDLGIKGDIDALHINADGTMIFSLDAPATLPGVGKVDDSDVIRLAPTQLGSTTAGSLSIVLRGADAGLTTNDEDIDALDRSSDGGLLVSLLGSGSVPKYGGGTIAVADEDLIRLNGSNNSWTVHFDGSDVQLTATSEDVWGAATDKDTGVLRLSTAGAFNVGFSGKAADVFACTPGAFGETTHCTYSLFWDGDAAGWGAEITDALSIGQPPAGLPALIAAAVEEPEDPELNDESEDLPDDPAIVGEQPDEEEEDESLYLPNVSK